MMALAESRATGLIVVPEWPAQPWWPPLVEMATGWRRLYPWDIRRVGDYAEVLVQPMSTMWAVAVDGSRAPSSVWA